MGHADIDTTVRYVHHVSKHDTSQRFSERRPRVSTARPTGLAARRSAGERQAE